MEPATPLVLTSDEHAMIGELVEIMGQIDDTMIETVGRLLKINRTAAAKIMVSNRVADNAAIWSQIIEDRTNDPGLSAFVAIGVSELKAMAELRNDFIDALFTPDYVEAGYENQGIRQRQQPGSSPGGQGPLAKSRSPVTAPLHFPASSAHRSFHEGSLESRPVTMAQRVGSLLQLIGRLIKLPIGEKSVSARPSHLGRDLNLCSSHGQTSMASNVLDQLSEQDRFYHVFGKALAAWAEIEYALSLWFQSLHRAGI